jgi:hypothetical protein
MRKVRERKVRERKIRERKAREHQARWKSGPLGPRKGSLELGL